MRIGIDLGSRMAKFALLEGGEVLRLAERDTVSFYRRYGKMEGDDLVLDLEAAAIFPAGELAGAPVTVTGYGRNTLSLRGARIVSEIRAHVSGAVLQTGLRDFVLLDLGGQDTKVAQVKGGKLADFVMNDKCAASSGRYLENMATVLDVTLDELSLHWEEPVPLDATCGIFGESELIGQILRGHPIPRLCAGVNQTLVRRVIPLLRRYPDNAVVVTGGVARNTGFLKLLGAGIPAELVVPRHPQHNGAIGCASI